MATKITYTNKVKSVDIPNPAEEKFRADDANEIKVVVNSNADDIEANTATLNALDGTNIELIKGGGIYLDTAIVSLQNLSLQDVTDNGNLTTNPIIAPSINGAAITSSGDGSSYLANDGTYKSTPNAVDSVNGETGAVVLDGNDIDWNNTSGTTIKAKIDGMDGQILANVLNKVEIGGDIGGTVSAPVINNQAITNAKLANMPTNRFKGRANSGNGVVEDLTVPQTKAVLSIDQVDNTSDADKPISNAVSTALDLVELDISSLYADKINKNVGTTYTTNALTTVTQAEYDAITPDSNTIYFIV
ncbi:hypothetical protein OAE03_01530 [Winogradskyella sp.]|nr:hypothetical protein [Winogradskyella sp.]MDC0009219.1 hypothetical protein [Winogradskyella sp.]